jgi:uncharacterized protein with FMN-binding domain
MLALLTAALMCVGLARAHERYRHRRAQEGNRYEAGTYTATVHGMNADIAVEVTVMRALSCLPK